MTPSHMQLWSLLCAPCCVCVRVWTSLHYRDKKQEKKTASASLLPGEMAFGYMKLQKQRVPEPGCPLGHRRGEVYNLRQCWVEGGHGRMLFSSSIITVVI